MSCRHCGAHLQHVFLDLGAAPPSNAYLSSAQLDREEYCFPLKVFVCETCWLVQLQDYTKANELFTEDYAYFSSTSSGWLSHAKHYCQMIVDRLNINQNSFVVEIASNDGYLLKNFSEHKIDCLGIEPTKSTAEAAKALGIPVLQEFFDMTLANALVGDGRRADLIVGNNVFAHVPDINNFTQGLATLLKPEGTITLEFPHLMQLIDLCQFDTIYHEHFSYLSLSVVQNIFAKAGLRIYDVEALSTHGGSLRVYGCHQGATITEQAAVKNLLNVERKKGLQSLAYYQGFQDKVEKIKKDLRSFLTEKKNNKERVVAYGAAAKGNTLLNYSGITPDLLPVVYDAAESKQGKYLPGSHISIRPPHEMLAAEFDYILILPWNIKHEIDAQLKKQGVRAHSVTAIPCLEIS